MSTTYRTLISLFEELRGERIIIRPYRESDAQDLFEAVAESRDHLRPWLPFADAHQTVEESRDWIIHTMAQWLLREELAMGMWNAATSRYLGGTGFQVHSWDAGYFEIGYWIRASEEGHGYITEAVRLLANYAFDALKANRLEIRCDEQNVRSAAVPRRLGFVQEGCLRNDATTPDGSPRSTLIFSLIPGEWHDSHN
ncbi:MAG: GNAT family N-acetyltransferase [Ktedonobacteraceae bacterium]